MKRLCTIEFWFRSQYYQGIVFHDKRTAFSEYHVSLLNPDWNTYIKGFYFIEGYDGSIELNQVPETSLQKEFLCELGAVIKDIQQQLAFNKVVTVSDHKVSFANCLQSDYNSNPSAAA